MVVAGQPCPIGRAADVLGDRWTLLILRSITAGATRFDQLHNDLGASTNVLSSRLAGLVGAGVLTKVPYRDDHRTRHEYRLTDAGADLLPVLHALARWGEDHTRSDRHTRPMKAVHAVCGAEMPFGDHCPHCDRTVARTELSWLRPWRSAAPVPLAEPVHD
ncbi:helix-turn-helix transcriptional regulator [Amycolatopsis sp. DSM 110486]|nr:helix-turn-helix transcriptional regulator [Amycolatopsis sp. DSM 110486]